MLFRSFAMLVFCATYVAPLSILGAGAFSMAETFSEWLPSFSRQFPSSKMIYSAVGSGEGLQKLFKNETRWAATSVQLTLQQRHDNPKIEAFPLVAFAVVVAYNLPGFSEPIILSCPLVAAIFNGSIAWWNDTRLQVDFLS